MIEKIQKVYDKIKHKYSDKLNVSDVRLELKTELLIELGDQVDVKCDEENNSPEIVDYNCMVATIMWDKKQNGSYKYTKLVFGNDYNIGQVQFLIN